MLYQFEKRMRHIPWWGNPNWGVLTDD